MRNRCGESNPDRLVPLSWSTHCGCVCVCVCARAHTDAFVHVCVTALRSSSPALVWAVGSYCHSSSPCQRVPKLAAYSPSDAWAPGTDTARALFLPPATLPHALGPTSELPGAQWLPNWAWASQVSGADWRQRTAQPRGPPQSPAPRQGKKVALSPGPRREHAQAEGLPSPVRAGPSPHTLAAESCS